MRGLCIALVFIGVGTLSGCATVTRGSTEVLVIESNPIGAVARLSSGRVCVTPCSLELPRKTSVSITFEKEGYRPTTAYVSSGIDGAGGAGMAGNVLVGGIVGIGIDSYSGANKSLSPNPVLVVMEKEDD
jgi:hypothetical protein